MTETTTDTQYRGIGFAPHEVVGYILGAEAYCPTHTITALPTGPGEAFDGWAIAADAVILCPEDNLDEIAWAFGINRRDEQTFDSEDFPKVLLAQDVISPGDAEVTPDLGYPTICGACHGTLVG